MLSRRHRGCPGRPRADPAKGQFGVQRDEVADGLSQPIYTAFAPGVTDPPTWSCARGASRALDPSDGSSQDFLDIESRVSTDGEGGLLSIAFHPTTSRTGCSTPITPPTRHTIRIDEYDTLSDTEAQESSRRAVLAVPHPGAENHQGRDDRVGPTASSTPHPVTAGPARSEGDAQDRGIAPREAAAHQPGGERKRRLLDAQQQPVRRPKRTRRDLGRDGAAQPVPLGRSTHHAAGSRSATWGSPD